MIEPPVEEGYPLWRAKERELLDALWSLGPEGRAATVLSHLLSQKLTELESAVYEVASAQKLGGEMIRLSAPGFGLIARRFESAAVASEAAEERLRTITDALLKQLVETTQTSSAATNSLVRATWALVFATAGLLIATIVLVIQP